MRREPLVVCCLLVLGASARVVAADEPCPMDFTVAAGGTLSTWIAESVDACMADPACAAGTTPSGDGAATEPAYMHPPPTRSPRGAFARGSVTLGGRSRGLYVDGKQARDAHLQIAATGQAGWHRGVRVCGQSAIDVGARTSGTSAFGVVFPHGLWSTAIGFEQDWDVQPSLSAPRRWLRRAYTSNRMSFGFAAATWRHRDGGVSSVFPMRIGTAWNGQAEADAAPTMMTSMRGAVYELVEPDRRLSIIPWTVDSSELMQRGRHSSAGVPPGELGPVGGVPDPSTSASPATISDDVAPSHWVARVGLFALAQDLADGTHVDVAAELVSSSEPLTCRGCQRFTGALGIDVPRGRDRWQLRVDRAAFLAIDDVVTFEDRLTTGYTRPRARHTLRATGFAAATRTTPPPSAAMTTDTTAPADDITVTGGVTLALDLAVGQGLTMTTELEIARSFYARLDGAVTPTAEPAARLGIVLARRFGRGADAAH